ncbi:MAG: hypothetical protein HRU25_05940, partial [Psychrobium sp.]|nr:hypothetical protein [Psychrobium sp.]
MNKPALSPIEAQLKSIQTLIQAAKFNDAITLSETLLAQSNDKKQQAELWYLVAVAQRYDKQFPKALVSINQLLELEQNHSRGNQEQGYIHLALDQASQ